MTRERATRISRAGLPAARWMAVVAPMVPLLVPVMRTDGMVLEVILF